MHVRVFLSRYRSYDICPKCNGTRFKEDTLLYRLGDLTIAQVYALNVGPSPRLFRAAAGVGDRRGRTHGPG